MTAADPPCRDIVAVALRRFTDVVLDHPHLRAALDEVEACIAPGVPPQIVLLIGSTGVGKTTLAKTLVRRRRGAASSGSASASDRDGPVASISCMSMGPRGYRFDVTHWQALAASIDDPFPTDHRCPDVEADRLRAGYPRAAKGTTASQRAAVLHLIRRLRVPLVVLDEAQHIAQLPGGRTQVQQLDVIKDSVDRSGATHLLVGTYDLRLMVAPNGQHARRARVVHFRPYDIASEADRTAFVRIFGQLVRALPLDTPDAPKRTFEALKPRLQDICVGTAGCVGILKDWLLRALQRALLSHRDALCWEDLEATRLPDLGLLHIAEEIREYREMEGRSHRSQIESALGLSGAAPPQPKRSRAERSATKPGRRAPARDPVGVPAATSVGPPSAA